MSILLADIDATCAALGYSDGERYQAEPDAVQGLKHLIWILRRDLDNHEYRRHLGHAKVLQTDLVYMLPDYVHEEEFADVLIRLLVILTNPTLLLYRDGPPKDNHGRKVFLELIEILQGYKTAFTNEKIWTALFGKMQKSLEIDWALRSEEQSLLIERILVLIRNVLQVPANPEAECRADNDASVHDQVIWALHRSGILDLVLFIVSSPDEHQFHLHCLEILCLLYREQTAESLADASLQRSVAEKQRDEQELIAARRREKQRLLTKPPPGRHSRFGGTYVIRNFKSVSDRDIICHQPLERVAAIDFDREKQQQKRSFRHVKEEAQVTRRSAFSVRLCLREYCIEVLRSAYNTLVRQVRRVLERNSGSAKHDDSYLLWAIRFFMEFNRLSGLQLQLVSESLSVQCFHWVLTRMQHDMDMIVSDKKQARLWAKRLHVGLQTFRELLQSMLALQKLKDDNALALFDMLLNNVCYVLEYRETILHLLMNYNEAHSTKAYLRDVVETANIFIKMMERFCKDTVVVQDKKRGKRKGGNKKPTQLQKTPEEIQEELENKWAEYAGTLSSLLANELELPEEDQPIPFDATSEKKIDDQKDDCMKRINTFLREEELEKAVALLRAAREVWPENDIFGAITAAPEDELLLLREIFLHNITTDEKSNDVNIEDFNDDTENEEYEGIEDNRMVEKTFKFEDFAKRLLNPKIVRACTIVLADWEHIPTKSLKATVTILHRIAYGCSCPAMLYQAKLFLIFQQVFNAARDAHHEELRRLAVYVVRKFVEIAPSNPKIYAELLFYKTIKEANELETGYCDAYESGIKGAWTEEQENELRLLFEENQRNPANDKDVIDWILENLIDKHRTRRGILKKLKELGLMFKAPTKKSTAAVTGGKILWQPEEDEELRSLYDMYRTEENCLERIMQEFFDRRSKQQIIKRMLQLHIIADKSEILPAKPRKRKSKKQQSQLSGDESNNEMEENYMEEVVNESGIRTVKPKNKKPLRPIPKKVIKRKNRKVKRTVLDVGTIRSLLEQVDGEKFQEAIDWLKRCLNNAAEKEEAPTEEDNAIPLVPLKGVEMYAFEDANFKKLLIALSMQPPMRDSEMFWRIPTYLNSEDLKVRARIVGGEEIAVDGTDVGEQNGDDDDYEGVYEFESVSYKSDNEEEEEEDEDALDIFARQRQRLNALLFSKSDEEDGTYKPKLKGKAQKGHKQKKKNLKKAELNSEVDEEDLKEVNELKRKLDKKKRHPALSSDEDNDVYVGDVEPEKMGEKGSSTSKAKTKNRKNPKLDKQKKLLANPLENADALFDQLRAKRNTRQKKVIATVDTRTQIDGEGDDDDDLLNFNSEDYRKRLLELGDSDVDEMDVDEIKTVAETESGEEKENVNKSNKHRTRRINMIDSDTDEENDNDDLIEKQKNFKDDIVASNDDVDKTSNQEHAVDDINGEKSNIQTITTTTTKKRRRSMNITIVKGDNDGNGNKNDYEGAMNVAFEANTSAVLIKSKKLSTSQFDDNDVNVDVDVDVDVGVDGVTKESVKRRRLAIVDDDDDDE